MKKPSFQFYPGDWLKDPSLRSCSPATRGIWMDLLCAIHEKDTCGISGTVDQLARIAGCFPDEMKTAIEELDRTGTADVEYGDAVVLVTSRRLERVAARRIRSRERAGTFRQKRQRNAGVTLASRENNAKVTPEITQESHENNAKVTLSETTENTEVTAKNNESNAKVTPKVTLTRTRARSEPSLNIVLEKEREEERERESTRSRVTPELPILDNGLNALEMFAVAFPKTRLTLEQKHQLRDRVRDGPRWQAALDFWKMNAYRPQSIGKLLEKYDELENSYAPLKRNQSGSSGVKRPSNADIIRAQDAALEPLRGIDPIAAFRIRD